MTAAILIALTLLISGFAFAICTYTTDETMCKFGVCIMTLGLGTLVSTAVFALYSWVSSL